MQIVITFILILTKHYNILKTICEKFNKYNQTFTYTEKVWLKFTLGLPEFNLRTLY